MMEERDFYLRVDVIVPKGVEELFIEDLYSTVLNKGLWIEDMGDDVMVKAYPEDVEEYVNQLKEWGFPIKDVIIVNEEKKDYSILTKRYFRPIRIGPLHIVAPWNRGRNDKDTIVIEPGMAFGTGRHESTRIMISLMGDLDMEDKDVFDMGCGSGILSIYASKLKARHVTAIDIDADAVMAARKNLSLNSIENVDIVYGGINAIKRRYDIILANLDIRTFELYAQEIVERCEETSLIVISGILNAERERLLSFFEPFVPLRRKKRGGWVGFVLKRGDIM